MRIKYEYKKIEVYNLYDYIIISASTSHDTHPKFGRYNFNN